jgi:hypothetical protein
VRRDYFDVLKYIMVHDSSKSYIVNCHEIVFTHMFLWHKLAYSSTRLFPKWRTTVEIFIKSSFLRN